MTERECRIPCLGAFIQELDREISTNGARLIRMNSHQKDWIGQ
jgi:hypothetical protein